MRLRPSGAVASGRWSLLLECAGTEGLDSVSMSETRRRRKGKGDGTNMKIVDGAAAVSGEAVVYRQSDLGNAERFRDTYRDKAMHVEGIGWHIFDATRWKHESRRVELMAHDVVHGLYDEAENLPDGQRRDLVRFALKSEASERLAAMLRQAQPMLSVKAENLDRDPMMLNLPNGVLDLRTGELRKHRPSDLCTKMALAPVDGRRCFDQYDPGATCPQWLEFLSWAFLGRADLLAFVQRMCGYLLTGDVREQAWFLLFGKGGNGKSVFSEVVEGILCDYAVRLTPDALFKGGQDAALAKLAGARMALSTEPEPGRPFRHGVLKMLTGESRFTAKRLYFDPFTFQMTAKIVISTNRLPPVRDSSDGFWRRLRAIPFDAAVEKDKRDLSLRNKLLAERAGILAWMARGAVEWHQHGLGMVPEVDAAVEAYRTGEDAVRGFLDDRCTLDPGKWESSAKLWQDFRAWCDGNGEEPGRRQDFSLQVGNTPNVTVERQKNGRGFRGIALRGDG